MNTWKADPPRKRRNPSGKTAWRARVVSPDGSRREIGTHATKREAVDATGTWLDSHRGIVADDITLDDYFERWQRRHPRRSERTNRSNRQRIRCYVLPELGSLPVHELRRRHVIDLIDHLAVEKEVAPKMARNAIASLSCLLSDAVDDDVAIANVALRVKVEPTDERFAGRRPREPKILSYTDMLKLARAVKNRRYRALVLFPGVTGARPAETYPRLHADLDRNNMRVRINTTAYGGRIEQGTKTDHGERDSGRWSIITQDLLDLIDAAPRSLTGLLWPTERGKVWQEQNFLRKHFKPARESLGWDDVVLYDLRHSFVSLMQAAKIPVPDLALATGHRRVSTLQDVYSHPLGRSEDAMRAVLTA